MKVLPLTKWKFVIVDDEDFGRVNLKEKGRITIGFFENKEEAAMNYDAVAYQLIGAFAKLNFS